MCVWVLIRLGTTMVRAQYRPSSTQRMSSTALICSVKWGADGRNGISPQTQKHPWSSASCVRIFLHSQHETANKMYKTHNFLFLSGFLIFFIEHTSWEKLRTRSTTMGAGPLTVARDWEMRVDLSQRLTFPPKIAVTNLRPDLVLWSESSQRVFIVELTVPWEDTIEEAFERKRLRYANLAAEAEGRGWKREGVASWGGLQRLCGQVVNKVPEECGHQRAGPAEVSKRSCR